MSESIRAGGDTGVAGPPSSAAEPRWPMATAVLAATILYVGMPHRGRVPGWWLGPLLQLLLLGLLITQDPGRIDRRSANLHRLMVALLVVMTLGTVLSVTILAVDILVVVKGVTATVLLGRGAAIWVENVIVFSLWYWQFDRGGPAERAAGAPIPPSFAFPENATPELAPVGWRPAYPDYLYLAYTNATAFSPTDTLPVRRWAKLTMMVQSTLSLVIAILVVARAINVLPG
ncbi:MAG TPA: hypothetical protein VFN05_11415 [Actinomycetes bacterium]|nr:hypothetical protein [Actinomycetes bacterium]